jgi:hypothetical protein
MWQMAATGALTWLASDQQFCLVVCLSRGVLIHFFFHGLCQMSSKVILAKCRDGISSGNVLNLSTGEITIDYGRRTRVLIGIVSLSIGIVIGFGVAQFTLRRGGLLSRA